MDDAKQELVELIEAFAAARSTQNRLLQTWAAQGLSSYINGLQIAPLEPPGTSEPPAAEDPQPGDGDHAPSPDHEPARGASEEQPGKASRRTRG